MPKYDFRCTSCDAVFEAFRGFAQGTEGVVCPEDGAPATRLVLAAAGDDRLRREVGQLGLGDQAAGPAPSGPSHGHSHGPGGHTH